MTRLLTRSLSVVVLAVAATVALAGSTLAHGPDPVLAGKPFAQDQILKFGWRSGAEPIASVAAAIKAAAADATATRGSRAATFAYASTGPNQIGYGSGATCGVNGLACFSRDAPNSFTMWLREQGHVFDWGTLKWCQAYKVAPTGCYDVETISLDEFGHVEGLDHHVNETDGSDYGDAVVQTYSRTKPKVGWNAHGFGVCDVATLQLVYDMTSWAAKYSTCNLLDTTLTLAAPTIAAYGAATTVTATLKVDADDTYQRLGGNPLSARTVTLQARAPGSTTWLSTGAMAGGAASGTYVKTLTLTADIQLRAVFLAPSDEGLTGSTSATATIDVGACRTGACPQSAGESIQ